MASSSLNNMSVHDKGGNQILLMPKLQFRWRVTFTQFGGTSNPGSLALTRQVMDMTRPQVKFTEIPMHIYNSTVYLAGKYNWEPITMKIRDDSLGDASRSIGDQLSKQLDFEQMASARAGVDYKFATHIDVLDGDNGRTEPRVLETWDLFGCMITTANYDAINYATNDAMTISLTIRFDNAAQYSPDGEPTLGYGGFQQSRAGDMVNAAFADS